MPPLLTEDGTTEALPMCVLNRIYGFISALFKCHKTSAAGYEPHILDRRC